jgi:hypothetical protein
MCWRWLFFFLDLVIGIGAYRCPPRWEMCQCRLREAPQCPPRRWIPPNLPVLSLASIRITSEGRNQSFLHPGEARRHRPLRSIGAQAFVPLCLKIRKPSRDPQPAAFCLNLGYILAGFVFR